MTIMNKLKILVEKVNSILEQMANFSRDTNEMKILEKYCDITEESLSQA